MEYIGVIDCCLVTGNGYWLAVQAVVLCSCRAVDPEPKQFWMAGA